MTPAAYLCPHCQNIWSYFPYDKPKFKGVKLVCFDCAIIMKIELTLNPDKGKPFYIHVKK